MEPEQHRHSGETYGGDGWADAYSYKSPQYQLPIYEYGAHSFVKHVTHRSPSKSTFTRMAPSTHTKHQQQLRPSWPSTGTNLTGDQTYITTLPAVLLPTKRRKSRKKHVTLTDQTRTQIWKYHELNPTAKHTEIGAKFGLERSTVSKVLRRKEKPLLPEDRGLYPAKSRTPNVDRALSSRGRQKQGLKLTDEAIVKRANFFSTTVGNNESHAKVTRPICFMNFEQKNGICAGKLSQTALETKSSSSSLNPDLAGLSASHSPNGISPISPDMLSPLSGGLKSEKELKGNRMDSYLDFTQNYCQTNSQSTTSLSSGFADMGPSSFSGGPSSTSTPYTFSPDTQSASLMSSQHSRPPPPSTSSTGHAVKSSKCLASTPLSQNTATLIPRHNQPLSTPPPTHNSPKPDDQFFLYAIDTTNSSPQLYHPIGNGPIHQSLLSTTPNDRHSGLFSARPSSTLDSPTQDDARRALDTLLRFFIVAPQGLFDQKEHMTILKLTETLRLQGNQGQNGA